MKLRWVKMKQVAQWNAQDTTGVFSESVLVRFLKSFKKPCLTLQAFTYQTT